MIIERGVGGGKRGRNWELGNFVIGLDCGSSTLNYTLERLSRGDGRTARSLSLAGRTRRPPLHKLHLRPIRRILEVKARPSQALKVGWG